MKGASADLRMGMANRVTAGHVANGRAASADSAPADVPVTEGSVSTQLAAADTTGGAGLILVVDDTEENRYVAGRWLERAGLRVAFASTGAEALRLARDDVELVELVVLDVHLPDLHGFEVARKLKANPATAHMPVLHLSAKYVSTADRVRALDGGADAYLTQPVEADELVASVGALLRLSRAQRSLSERNRELEAAQEEATRRHAVAEQVLALSIALSTAGTPREVADAVCLHASRMFGAAGAVIARRSADGAHVELLSATDMGDEVRSAWSRFPLSAQVPLADVARTGEPLFLESRADWLAQYPDIAPLADSAAHQANAVAPLIVDDRIVGALGVAYADAHRFSADDRALLQSTARHAALALERARLLESEHESREVAESASRAKSDFLAVISHELRTPLNAIAGYAELIELGVQGPVTPEQLTSLARIQRSQRHLLGLINGVLNYSRVEGGHVHYDVQAIALEEILATCEALVAPQALTRGLQLRCGGCPEGVRVLADGEKVQQIVLNLLSNAVKFTERGGAVELLCVAEAGSSTPVLVRVRDTGLGIDAAQRERVFQPFVQLDAQLTRTSEGTGLGLAISRDLARGMGGELTVESALGKGSTFTLTLPRAPTISPTSSA